MKTITSILLIGMALIILPSHDRIESPEIDVDNPQPFDINDYTWLAGHWIGEGFGGLSEEMWSMPEEGTMMGMFRQVNDDKVVFYEFLLLDKDGLKLKHFQPDLTGWETKDKYVTFPMIEYSKTKIALKGLVYELKSENEMEIRLRLKEGDEVRTEVFTLRRQ
ncbi:MAG: DUF6265 family protein [Bacteroidota bacterium]